MRQHVEAAGGVERDVMKIMSDFDMDADFRISYKEFLENALNRIECDGDVESRQKLERIEGERSFGQCARLGGQQNFARK